jgi:hypothetical protein
MFAAATTGDPRGNQRTEEIVAESIIREDLTVPDVYAILYGDDVDWHAEFANLLAGEDVEPADR